MGKLKEWKGNKGFRDSKVHFVIPPPGESLNGQVHLAHPQCWRIGALAGSWHAAIGQTPRTGH